MVSEVIVERVLAVTFLVGPPVIVALFYGEGLVVGKVLQPPAVFIGYVAVATPSQAWLVGLIVGCLVANVLGQWTLYRGFDADAPEFVGLRRTVPYLDSLPGRVSRRVGEKRLRLADRLFERYGIVAIAGTNLIPGVRGLLAIPAGLGGYPIRRFLAATAFGTAGYLLLLVGVARGAIELVRVFGAV